MTIKLPRGVTLAVVGLVAAAAMIVAPISAAGVHTDKARARTNNGVISVVPPIPPIPPITPEYGAIAIADNGTVGKAWNHRTRAQAEIDALTMCGHPSCQVISSFTQCGAVAYDGSTFHGGVGGTRHTAKNDAMARLGGGRIITSACN